MFSLFLSCRLISILFCHLFLHYSKSGRGHLKYSMRVFEFVELIFFGWIFFKQMNFLASDGYLIIFVFVFVSFQEHLLLSITRNRYCSIRFTSGMNEIIIIANIKTERDTQSYFRYIHMCVVYQENGSRIYTIQKTPSIERNTTLSIWFSPFFSSLHIGTHLRMDFSLSFNIWTILTMINDQMIKWFTSMISYMMTMWIKIYKISNTYEIRCHLSWFCVCIVYVCVCAKFTINLASLMPVLASNKK